MFTHKLKGRKGARSCRRGVKTSVSNEIRPTNMLSMFQYGRKKPVESIPYRTAGIYRTDSEPVQKHPWFVPLKIPVLTGLYRTYCRISDISAEKWIPGGTKNLKKMKKVSSRKLTMPSSLVVFPCCRPFPKPSSFCFIQPLHFFLLLLLLLFLLLLQFWPILFFLCLLF